MEPLEVAQAYFDAWNLQDPAEIAATFAPGGTYADPTTGQPLSGQAIVEYTSGLVSAFPDLSFGIVSTGVAGDGTVAAQWRMEGTNSGPFGGEPPTGQTVELPGPTSLWLMAIKFTPCRATSTNAASSSS